MGFLVRWRGGKRARLPGGCAGDVAGCRVMWTLDALRAKLTNRVADAEGLVLLAIAELPKGRRFSDLAGRTGLGQNTLASALKRVRKRGEVARDETRHYRLTEEGRRLVEMLTGKEAGG